jgi:hypothetical protein
MLHLDLQVVLEVLVLLDHLVVMVELKFILNL